MIYILISGWSSDIVGVYSTLEKAKEAQKTYADTYENEPLIESYLIDEFVGDY